MSRHYSPEARAKMEADRLARNAHRLEDVTFLAQTGENLDGAAKRLGLTGKTLEMWCRRNAPDLRSVLISRQPIGLKSDRRLEGAS